VYENSWLISTLSLDIGSPYDPLKSGAFVKAGGVGCCGYVRY